MTERNFVVKNGLTVNTGFSANGSTITLGANLAINVSSYWVGNSSGNTTITPGSILINGVPMTGGATLNANNTDSSTYYIGLSGSFTGVWSNAVVASSKLTFVPSTGQLVAGGSTIGANNTFVGTVSTAQCNVTSQVLSDGSGTINWDTSQGQIATCTFTGTSRTVAAPTNLKIGTYILHLIQDGVGSRTITTWNSVFKWPAGAAPVLSTAANKRDIFSFVCDGTYLYGSYLPNL